MHCRQRCSGVLAEGAGGHRTPPMKAQYTTVFEQMIVSSLPRSFMTMLLHSRTWSPLPFAIARSCGLGPLLAEDPTGLGELATLCLTPLETLCCGAGLVLARSLKRSSLPRRPRAHKTNSRAPERAFGGRQQDRFNHCSLQVARDRLRAKTRLPERRSNHLPLRPL